MGAIALPQHGFGPDVIALVGRLRHVEHRSIPAIDHELTRHGVTICVRSVASLLDRYDELLAPSPSDPARLRRDVAQTGRVILAIDGLQPDVGHDASWVLRDVLGGEALLARSLPSSGQDDLAKLLREAKGGVDEVGFYGFELHRSAESACVMHACHRRFGSTDDPAAVIVGSG